MLLLIVMMTMILLMIHAFCHGAYFFPFYFILKPQNWNWITQTEACAIVTCAALSPSAILSLFLTPKLHVQPIAASPAVFIHLNYIPVNVLFHFSFCSNLNSQRWTNERFLALVDVFLVQFLCFRWLQLHHYSAFALCFWCLFSATNDTYAPFLRGGKRAVPKCNSEWW